MPALWKAVVETTNFPPDELPGQLSRHDHRLTHLCLSLGHPPAPLGVDHPLMDVHALLPAPDVVPGQDLQLQQVLRCCRVVRMGTRGLQRSRVHASPYSPSLCDANQELQDFCENVQTGLPLPQGRTFRGG